jgi:choline monooxygenase
MTTSEDQKVLHANAYKYKVNFPEQVEFPEHHKLTLEESRIPTSRYTSEEWLKKELANVWYRTWQMACREEEVANPGDFYEYIIGAKSFLIVRGDDMKLRAFYNVCQHRGNQLKNGAGNSQDLRCTFHAWCWSLNGKVKEIPQEHLFTKNGDADEFDLDAAAVDVWAGFVFIHPKPAEAEPLLDFLSPLAEQVRPYHFERFRATTHSVMHLDANWKVALEAFLEAYHVGETHPQILPYLDDINTAFQRLGDHSLMVVPYGVPSMRLEHVEPLETYEAYFTKSATSFRHKKHSELGVAHDLPADLFNENGEWIYDGSMRDYMIDRASTLGAQFGHDYSELSRDQLVDDYDYHIFPGTKFNSHAGATLFFRSRPHATDPNKCIFDLYTLLWGDENVGLPEPAPERVVDVYQESLGQVLDQDFSNIPKIQRGLLTNSLEFCTLGGAEVRIANFHAVLGRYVDRD